MSPPPPIIEEIEADEDVSDEDVSDAPQPEELTAEQRASSALEKCHQILHDAQQPIDNRYNELIAHLPPIEEFLASPTNPSPDGEFVSRLLELLVPSPALAPEETFLPDDESFSAPSPALSAFHTFSYRLLSRLPTHPPSANPQLAKALASFTSQGDAWTTEKTHSLAQFLLKVHQSALETPSNLLSILRELRPLFTLPAPTPSTAQLTAAGRIALRPSTNTSISVTPPPYTQHLFSIPLLEWILKDVLPADSLDEAWPLLVPPILTLNDSTSVITRIRAVGLTRTLLYRLDQADSTLLKRTGLGTVFWDATLPNLSWLPPLTPEPYSYQLFDVSFSCLITLANTLEPKYSRKRAVLLDVVVRDGFLRGMGYAGEYVSIATLLVIKLRDAVKALEVYAVRHLRSVTTLLSEVLANPLGNASPKLLEETLETLQVVCKVCWVKLSAYVPEILRGVLMCWRRVMEDGGELEAVMEGCRKVVMAVKAVVEAEDGGANRWENLVQGIWEVEGLVVDRLLE